MHTEHYEDVTPLSSLKANLGKMIDRIRETHRPVLLTISGDGVAVLQALEDYESTEEELRFMKAVAKGLIDVHENNTVSLDEAKEALSSPLGQAAHKKICP